MADEYDSVPFPCCACDGTVIFTDQGERPTFFHTMPYCERFNATNTTEQLIQYMKDCAAKKGN